MEMSVLFDKLLIFLVLMVIGWGCIRSGFLDRSFARSASALTMNVFMPATIINATLAVNTDLSMGELGRIMLILCLMQVLGYVIAFLVAKFLPLEKENSAEYELLMSMGNNLFIGLPIVDALLGPLAVFYVSLTCLPFNVLIYTYGVWRLKSSSSEHRLRLKDMLSTPLAATVISLVLILLRPPVPSALRGLISSMAGATMPLSMVVIGASMGTVSLLDAFRRKSLYLCSAVRLLLVPVLTWLLLRLLTDDPVLLMTAVITSACPSAVLVSVLAIQYGHSGIYASEGILQSTLLSMATIPVLIMLLF